MPIMVDVPLGLSAQGTASRVETLLTNWVGIRVGTETPDDGVYWGGDGSLLLGEDGAGTPDVQVSRLTPLLEARGRLGMRTRYSQFSVGGYTYAGVGLGVNFLTTKAFEDERLRATATTTVRAGLGATPQFGPVRFVVETGAGWRDLRFELHGSIAGSIAF